jgi:hypothetical protein
MQQGAVLAVVILSAVVMIGVAERRPRRAPYASPKEFNRRERRWQLKASLAVIALTIVTGVVGDRITRSERRNNHICLLLAFRPVSAQQDPKTLERIWTQFCATWKDVFARVDGVTIFPEDVSEKEFAALDLGGGNRARVLAHVATLRPSLILETIVNTPEPTGTAVLLTSRVCTIDRGGTRPTGVAFGWRGGTVTQHTALQGAADLLRHLHTLGTPPLSAAQHQQASRNLLESYWKVLNVSYPVQGDLLASVERAKSSPEPVTDDQLADFLNAFQPAQTAVADAQTAQAASRDADLAKISVAR